MLCCSNNIKCSSVSFCQNVNGEKILKVKKINHIQLYTFDKMTELQYHYVGQNDPSYCSRVKSINKDIHVPAGSGPQAQQGQ